MIPASLPCKCERRSRNCSGFQRSGASMRPGLTHGLKWHRGMTGYMLRPTPNPGRSGRDGIAEHALQRYKGLKSNGRDGKGGTGCSPKARRRIAPTRPGGSRFPSRKRGHASDEMGAAYAAGYARDKPKNARARRADSAVGLEHRARQLQRPDLHFTAPRTERPGRGTDRGYSFVSMSHHTARGKARPVMG